jgi:putative endonuclease
MFTVYILRTSANTLYIGQTKDFKKRMQQHAAKSPESAKYMRYFTSFELVHTESYQTRSEAMKREYQLKQLPRKKKEALIAGEIV